MHKNVYFGSEVMLLCFAQLFGFWEVVTLSIARVTPLSMDVTPLSMNITEHPARYSVITTDKHTHKDSRRHCAIRTRARKSLLGACTTTTWRPGISAHQKPIGYYTRSQTPSLSSLKSTVSENSRSSPAPFPTTW
jgi:hypothetical protein